MNGESLFPETPPPLHLPPQLQAVARSASLNCRPSFRFENAVRRKGAKIVAGVDEAGRGPLAGPVVAAAAILPEGFRLRGLNDSKQLTPEQRDMFYVALKSDPRVVYNIGIVNVDWIDRINILQATWRAMLQAIGGLVLPPDHVLVDGLPVPLITINQTAIVDGDARSMSIAAASVIAKVTRDRLMMELHQQFPVYDFASNKGYATPEHLSALREHGPCPIHRQTFGPVREKRVQSEMGFLSGQASKADTVVRDNVGNADKSVRVTPSQEFGLSQNGPTG